MSSRPTDFAAAITMMGLIGLSVTTTSLSLLSLLWWPAVWCLSCAGVWALVGGLAYYRLRQLDGE